LDKKGGSSSRYITPELKEIIKSRSVSFDNKDRVKISKGYRNPTLISVANSILFTHLQKDRGNEDKLKQFFLAINYFLCERIMFVDSFPLFPRNLFSITRF
jgi:hypothetical protein